MLPYAFRWQIKFTSIDAKSRATFDARAKRDSPKSFVMAFVVLPVGSRVEHRLPSLSVAVLSSSGVALE